MGWNHLRPSMSLATHVLEGQVRRHQRLDFFVAPPANLFGHSRYAVREHCHRKNLLLVWQSFPKVGRAVVLKNSFLELTSNRNVVFRFRLTGLFLGQATDPSTLVMFLLALEICGAVLILFFTIAIGVGFFQAMWEDLRLSNRKHQDEQQPVELKVPEAKQEG